MFTVNPFNGWSTLTELRDYLDCDFLRYRIIEGLHYVVIETPGIISPLVASGILALKPMGLSVEFRPLSWWRCRWKTQQGWRLNVDGTMESLL